MATIRELRRLQYYFIDLPLWTYGYRSHAIERRRKLFNPAEHLSEPLDSVLK
jgi:hypothetical protein